MSLRADTCPWPFAKGGESTNAYTWQRDERVVAYCNLTWGNDFDWMLLLKAVLVELTPDSVAGQ